jgi:hypothetical protein
MRCTLLSVNFGCEVSAPQLVHERKGYFLLCALGSRFSVLSSRFSALRSTPQRESSVSGVLCLSRNGNRLSATCYAFPATGIVCQRRAMPFPQRESSVSDVLCLSRNGNRHSKSALAQGQSSAYDNLVIGTYYATSYKYSTERLKQYGLYAQEVHSYLPSGAETRAVYGRAEARRFSGFSHTLANTYRLCYTPLRCAKALESRTTSNGLHVDNWAFGSSSRQPAAG